MQWTVVGQAETTQLGPDHKAVAGMTVRFKLDSGTVASVFVPWDQYTAEKVKEAIGARVAHIAGIEGLTGS